MRWELENRFILINGGRWQCGAFLRNGVPRVGGETINSSLPSTMESSSGLFAMEAQKENQEKQLKSFELCGF